MGNLRRWVAGQPPVLSAGTWNRFCDATEWIESQGVLGSGVGTRPDILTAELLIRVKNTSGSDVERFGVLALGSPVFDPADDDSRPGFLESPVVTGLSPSLSNWGRFVIAAEPIAAGRIGNAVITGIVPCKINVFKTTHLWADVKNGDLTQLNSDDCGNAMILSPLASTGDGKWAYLQLGCPSTQGFCVAQGTFLANSSGNIKFSDDQGNTWGGNVPARYVANDGNPSIVAGTVCYRSRIANGWYISPVGCDE